MEGDMYRFRRLLIGIIFFLGGIMAQAQGVVQRHDQRAGLASDVVFDLAVANKGTLWAGTLHGLSRFDGVRWRVPFGAQRGPDAWITSLAYDAAADRLWAGTYGDGLWVWDGVGWETLRRVDSGLPDDWITALALDEQGNVWIGTLTAGLARFDGVAWTYWDVANGALPRDAVSAIATGTGQVWVGLSDGGLCQVSPSARCYRVADSGLAHDDVTALAVAPDGRMWIGTSQGLTAFDVTSDTWWRWPVIPGSTSQRVRALWVDGQGVLWVGTGAGAVRYDGQDWMAAEMDAIPVSAVVSDGERAWLGTLGAGVLAAPILCQDQDDSEAPLPVVVVHGWRGPDSDRIEDSEFKYLKRWLQATGRQVFYATGVHPDNTLHRNAANLRDNIARVKALTGRDQVDVIAFSMGGLNTRTLIESAIYEQDVHQALIMGTPHAGVTMWKPFLLYEIAAWSDEPSARELLPEHVALFNRTHSNNWQVPYTLFAGAAQAEALPSLFDLLPPSDGLISAWSAHALTGPFVRYVTTPDLHAWSSETLLLDIPSFLWPRTTYDRAIRPVLQGQSAMVQPPAWQSLPDETHAPLVSGRVQGDQVRAHPLVLDWPGTHRVYVRGQGSQPVLSLVDPQGEVYDAERAMDDGDLSYFALPYADFASLVLTTTITGIWDCRVALADADGPPTDYALYGVIDSPRRLVFDAEADHLTGGSVATLRATLSGGQVDEVEVKAVVYDPQHQAETVVLYDDGQHGDGLAEDGVFGGIWQAPARSGYYPVFLSARGQGEGTPFAVGTEGVLIVASDAARLLGSYRAAPVDGDRDGVYEALRVDVALGVEQAGPFILSARMETVRGDPIGTVARPVELGRGLQWVALDFAGSWIARSGSNGPYIVTDVVLMDGQGAAILLDEDGPWATEPYDGRDFG